MAKWPTSPDQDQRILEPPLVSFPLSPWQLSEVGTEGGWEKEGNEKSEFVGGQGRDPLPGQTPYLPQGC